MMILVPGAIWGQVATATNPVSSTVAVPAPVLQAPVAVVPAQPTIAAPRPAEVVIPSATAPPPASSVPATPTRVMPLNVPTTQELLTKSITSAPGRSQDRLNALTPSLPALSPTNKVAPAVGTPIVSAPTTNTPASQPGEWQKKNPLLDGVDYHW